MKLNKIFMAIAAMAIVGCSSDDLSVSAPEQGQAAADSRLIELDPNFVIAGVGVEENGTRTHWEKDAETGALVNKFLPIYKADPDGSTKLDKLVDLTGAIETPIDFPTQAVGLCYLGDGAVGTDVYTNYQFYHFGWLNKGESEADVDKCGKLYNGAMYDEITPKSGSTAGKEVNVDPTTGDFLPVPTALPAKAIKDGKDNLNYNTGVYRTDNKTIFGGKYVVYYPYNPGFETTGTIPAVATTVFNDVSTTFDAPELGEATFRYSSPVTIEGGYQAANFGLYNLSALVQLRVATPEDDPYAGSKTISQVILYSPSGKFFKQANLAADKIAANKKGVELYSDKEGETVGTKTITANFASPVYLQETTSTSPKPTSAYVTVLPTTVDDLKALVYSPDLQKWAEIDLGNTVFEAGQAKRLDIIVKKSDFHADFIAVDDASFAQALYDARLVATKDNPITIKVIGDVTLTGTVTSPLDPTTLNDATDANITIAGDAIVVPENVTFTVRFVNMESDIRVLGKSCCTSGTGGRLKVLNGSNDGKVLTRLNNITMVPTEARVGDATDYKNYNPKVTFNKWTTNGKSTIAAGKKFDVQAGTVGVYYPVEHKGDLNIADEDAILLVNKDGNLNFMGGSVVNDGTIEVLADGNFDMTDANGNATANDGLRMTNNGKFIHNVDAQVGTAVQKMHQNGEYRCKVNEQIKLDDAFLQWTACSVIEMVNTSTYKYNLGTAAGIKVGGAPSAYKHNGAFIDIEVNSGDVTTFAAKDNEEIKVGNLTVIKGGLDIDFIKDKDNKRSLTVNGDMTVKATTNMLTSSTDKGISITGNLTVEKAALTYKGGKFTDGKLNNGKLAVAKDINVSGAAAIFNAPGTATTDVDALNITCANFYLADGATAVFGNRTDGAAHNLDVSGTISNPEGCTFNIINANQNGAGSVLGWVTCKTLLTGGAFPGSKPRVD